MKSRLISLLLLATAIAIPPGKTNPSLAIFFSTLAVIHFWWTHAFDIRAVNWRFLFFFFGVSFLSWGFLNGSNLTGVEPSPEFDPDQIRSLKRSHRVALRVYLDHAPTEEERYFRIGYQNPKKMPSQDQEARSWVLEHLNGKPLSAKLDAIRQWFASDFTYSLDSDWKGLDRFLFRSRKGYCLHFSYASLTLLRLGGDSAQMVYGYSGGSWNRLTRTLTFHDDDAHSWLEVHDPASGRWLRVDPTEWVLREIPEKESGDLWTGLPAGSAMVWVLLLVSGLLSVYLFRDPREQLLALFPAPEAEPLSARIRSHSSGTGKRAVLLDSVARDYEDLYYSPRGVTGKKLRLQLNILKLRILIRWSRTWS